MKVSKKTIKTQRSIIERRLQKWAALKGEMPPKSGWIKAIRGALGMSTYQLAKLMDLSQASVSELEKREERAGVSLDSLQKAARAMNCKLVYAMLPADQYDSLDAIISERAEKLAKKILLKVEHSMELEKQGSEITASEIKKLSEELKNDADSRIWEVDK